MLEIECILENRIYKKSVKMQIIENYVSRRKVRMKKRKKKCNVTKKFEWFSLRFVVGPQNSNVLR